MGKVLTNSEVQSLKDEITGGGGWENDFLLGYYHSENYPEFILIEQEGGGEGGGERCYSILKWKDTFYQVTYSYYSYDGFDFDYQEWSVVEPVERLVTVYE